MITCKNCGTAFSGNYCYHCGQKASVKRIRMNWLVHELPHAVWHVDKGFFYNMKELYLRPGYAIADYIAGKRVRFFHPITYLLLLFAVQYAIVHYIGVHYYDPVQDVWMNERQAARAKEYDQTQQDLYTYYYSYLAMFIPVAALIGFVILRTLKTGYNYAEAVIINCFLMGQLVILQTIGLLLASMVGKASFTRTQDQVVFVSFAILLFIQFYQLGITGKRKWKKILLAMLAMAAIIGWAMLLLFLHTWLVHG